MPNCPRWAHPLTYLLTITVSSNEAPRDCDVSTKTSSTPTVDRPKSAGILSGRWRTAETARASSSTLPGPADLGCLRPPTPHLSGRTRKPRIPASSRFGPAFSAVDQTNRETVRCSPHGRLKREGRPLQKPLGVNSSEDTSTTTI
jgi:hypothetical protein